MDWPTPQDYNEAIQAPAISFEDPDLRIGQAQTSELGFPRPITGAFASVYRIHSQNKDWAVRCFLRNVADQNIRYQTLSRYLPANGTPYTPGFQYMARGIRLGQNWYPILKMEWLDGKSLDQFVAEHISNPQTMRILAEKFRDLVLALNRNGLAHGDLQHGNILVVGNQLKLVDYDGMFAPELSGLRSTELGQPNYQHPLRSAEHFGPYLDNFSAWLIYCSLVSLSIDNSLWQKLAGGDECLLLKQADLTNPFRSYAFSTLEHHPAAQIQLMARILRTLLRHGPEEIPPITALITPQKDLPALPEPASLLSTRVQIGAWSNESAPERVRSFWPKLEYFEQAVKTPNMVFKDRELRRSQFTFESHSGRHSFVCHLKGVKHVAVKCFLRDIPDRETRYYEIRSILSSPARQYFVDFEFQREGIHNAQSRWFPVLKMDWVAGPTLDVFVLDKLKAGDRTAPAAVLFKFREMMQTLYNAGIAHGDISAKNIIVTLGGLKLVDYDNLFVKTLAGHQGCEFGEPIYQHPARNSTHYGLYLDNYPAWVIDNALTFLATYPDSFHWGWDYIVQLVRDDQLLYTDRITNQLVEPVMSWYVEPEIRRRAHLMQLLMQFPIEQIPPIIEDFSSNIVKREALLESINKAMGRPS